MPRARAVTRDGYAATTIAAIARHAGVSVQTVYATYGSKRAILSALIELIEEEAELPRLWANLEAAAGRPARQLRQLAFFSARLFGRGGDVLVVVQGASTTGPDLASAWRESEARRRHAVSQIVAGWPAGALRPDLTEQRAVGILARYLSGPEQSGVSVSHSDQAGTGTRPVSGV